MDYRSQAEQRRVEPVENAYVLLSGVQEYKKEIQTFERGENMRPAVLIALSLIARAQQQAAFEVASVKPSNPKSQVVTMDASPSGRFSATKTTVRALIRFAYRVPDVQISGGPSWINTENYDVIATAGVASSVSQMQVMMQSLLAERFKLALDRETKSVRAYVLVPAKSGPKLRESTSAEGSIRGARGQAGGTRLIAKGVSIAQFSAGLSPLLGYPVLDKTGLVGNYDFEIEWTPSQPPPTRPGDDGPPPDVSGTSIFSALQEQLGLRIEARKEPVDILVVQHAEKPTQN
jgi:uncharacterized protein (TIGR03435 family)